MRSASTNLTLPFPKGFTTFTFLFPATNFKVGARIYPEM